MANSTLNTYSWLVEDPRDPNYVICKEHSVRRSQANGRAFARWRKNKSVYKKNFATHHENYHLNNNNVKNNKITQTKQTLKRPIFKLSSSSAIMNNPDNDILSDFSSFDQLVNASVNQAVTINNQPDQPPVPNPPSEVEILQQPPVPAPIMRLRFVMPSTGMSPVEPHNHDNVTQTPILPCVSQSNDDSTNKKRKADKVSEIDNDNHDLKIDNDLKDTDELERKNKVSRLFESKYDDFVKTQKDLDVIAKQIVVEQQAISKSQQVLHFEQQVISKSQQVLQSLQRQQKILQNQLILNPIYHLNKQ